MTDGLRLKQRLGSSASVILGWILVIVGIPLLPLPGPGTIVIVAGLALLSRRYVWAQKLLDPVHTRAVEAAKAGVETWPRIVSSALGGLWLFALGVLWWSNPTIPEFDFAGQHFGPRLPFGGWATGLGLLASSFVAWALLIFSVKRWRVA